MNFEQQTTEIRKHLEHARKKHPFFASKMSNTTNPFAWKDFGCGIKKLLKDFPTAHNVLEAEFPEIFEAFYGGNLEQARYEIFDTVAVLLRMEENLDDFFKKEIKP